ncbi:MAG: hypothetical protein ABI415_00050 [Flavitalea sp.]
MKWLLFVCTVLAIYSCKKESTHDPISAEDRAKAIQVADIMLKHEYHLANYYSLTPIDYIDTDAVVKAETDLNQYVSPWLVDDRYQFTSSNVIINQDSIKIANNDSAVLKRNWYVAADKDGVRIDFVGHQYQILTYRLVSFSDTNLVVWAYWNNNKDQVYSEFKVVQ